MDKKIKELEKAEKELTILINTNKKAWVKIYIMIEQIDTKELWKAIGNSFSRWLKSYAKKTGTNESMLWHRRQAGKFYRAYEVRAKERTKEIQKLSEIKISATNLNLIEKISAGNDKIADKMIEQLLKKEITHKELTTIWETTKEERLKKGKPIHFTNHYDKNKSIETIITSEQILKQDIIILLGKPQWFKNFIHIYMTEKNNLKPKEYSEFYYLKTDFPIQNEQGIQRIEFLIIENLTVKNKGFDVSIHEINIFKRKQHQEKETSGTEYQWTIILNEQDQKNITKVNPNIGIILFQKEKQTLKIIKFPHKIKTNTEIKTQILSSFINQSYIK